MQFLLLLLTKSIRSFLSFNLYRTEYHPQKPNSNASAFERKNQHQKSFFSWEIVLYSLAFWKNDENKKWNSLLNCKSGMKELVVPWKKGRFYSLFTVQHRIIAGIALKSLWPEWGLLEHESSWSNGIDSSKHKLSSNGTGQRCNFLFLFAILRSIKLQINTNGSVYICNKT